MVQKGGFGNMQERYIENFKLFISVSTLDCPTKMHRHLMVKRNIKPEQGQANNKFKKQVFIQFCR